MAAGRRSSTLCCESGHGHAGDDDGAVASVAAAAYADGLDGIEERFDEDDDALKLIGLIAESWGRRLGRMPLHSDKDQSASVSSHSSLKKALR